MMEDTKKDASELYRLAFLLTGRPDISIDVASDTVVSQYEGNAFFAEWMQAWSRRIVIAKALVAVRHEVAESVRRVKSARADRFGPMPQGWTLRPDTTKAEVEEALLDLDVFPRATVLLLIFERVPIADAATLLDADTALVKKAQAIGLGEFSSNLAQQATPYRARFPVAGIRVSPSVLL